MQVCFIFQQYTSIHCHAHVAVYEAKFGGRASIVWVIVRVEYSCSEYCNCRLLLSSSARTVHNHAIL